MNPFFEISQQPIFVNNREVKNRLAIVNEETGNVLGIVGKKYEIVHNSKVGDLFADALQGYDCSKILDHLDSDGKRWKRQIIFNDARLKYDIGDIVGIMLEIFNAYDGKTSFGYEIFGFRFACENGLVTGKRSLFSKSYHHFQNNPEKLLKDFESHFETFSENVRLWENWSKITIDRSIFDDFIMEQTFLGERLSTELTENYNPLLREMDLPQTVWGAFQVITYFSTHKVKARHGSGIFSHRRFILDKLIREFYKRWS